MMDEEKLEEHVERHYALRDEEYDIRTYSSDGYFQITVEHLEQEGPNLEELKEEFLDSFVLSEKLWELETEENEDYSHMYVSKEISYTSQI